jgi:hypothetical protein
VLGVAKVYFALGTKNIAVKICDPLPSARGDVEVADGALDVCRDAAPVEFRITIGQISRRGVTELPVHADFFKFVKKGIGFTKVMRIAELADQIGGTHQHAFFVTTVVSVGRKARGLDGIGDTSGVEQFILSEAMITNSLDRST